MDNLLRQLRHSMAELSIQGEDFARQMWQMYSIFEEFLNNHLGWNHSVTSNASMSQAEEEVFSSLQVAANHSGTSDELSTSSPIKDVLPSSKTQSPEMCNPLLETIRIIQSLDAMDECANSTKYCQQKNKFQEKLTTTTTLDGDKDSVGYAGSNSIDSGYKSSCPTPDLSDGSCYGGEGKMASCSSLNRVQCESKPRIAMGTRVMHRQHQYPYTNNNNKRNQCDVSLDHLMHLRQTLVTAMQQCHNANDNDSSKCKTPEYSRPKKPTTKLGTYQRSADHNHFLQCAALDTHSRRMPSPTLGSRQLRTPSPRPQRLRRVSSPSLSSWNQPQSPASGDDFNGLYGFRPYKSARSEPSVANGIEHRQSTNVRNTRSARTFDSTACGSQSQKTIRFNVDDDGSKKLNTRDADSSPIKCKSKPILKDPICANLRAQLELDPNDPTIPMLEEEIDTLLYGKTENTNVKQSNNIPCSYVTMIEDKYRRSSVARVKKLRDRVSDANAYPVDATVRLDKNLLLDEPLQMSSPTRDTTNIDPSDMKSRFSEVACCMLEIIEDLQRQKLLSNPTKAEEVNACPLATKDIAQREDDDCSVIAKKDLHAADYHVYEEIMYDLGMGHHRHDSPKRGPGSMPPPLPKRPDGGFRPSGSMVSNASQPKQRLNLYSLFQEQSDRRSIAVSLEQESKTMDDDYGFKMVNEKSSNKFF